MQKKNYKKVEIWYSKELLSEEMFIMKIINTNKDIIIIDTPLHASYAMYFSLNVTMKQHISSSMIKENVIPKYIKKKVNLPIEYINFIINAIYNFIKKESIQMKYCFDRESDTLFKKVDLNIIKALFDTTK